MSGAMIVNSGFDKQRFETAVSGLIQRHDALRTSFHVINEEPVQRIHDSVSFDIQYHRPVQPGDGPIEKQLIDAFIKPFDLAEAPLLRAGLFKLEQGRHLLVFDMHHIIGDGTSMGILTDDFIQLYESGPESLPKPGIQYKDFTLWQNSLIENGEIEAQTHYWQNVFPTPGDIPVLHLPTDFPRPPLLSFAGDNYDFSLAPELATEVTALGTRTGSTLYMTLMAAFNILLSKYSRQDDIVVGIGIMGRPHADLQKIIGMFVNSLPLRSKPIGKKSILQLLEEVKAHSIDAFDNQDIQFESLVEKLNPQRDASRTPVFDVSFVFQNFQQAQQEMHSLQMEPYRDDNKTAKFDLTLFSSERNNHILFNLEYRTSLFRHETIQRMAGHLLNILDRMVKNPYARIETIDFMSEDEKQLLTGNL